jgi:hypothetical protein
MDGNKQIAASPETLSPEALRQIAKYIKLSYYNNVGVDNGQVPHNGGKSRRHTRPSRHIKSRKLRKIRRTRRKHRSRGRRSRRMRCIKRKFRR